MFVRIPRRRMVAEMHTTKPRGDGRGSKFLDPTRPGKRTKSPGIIPRTNPSIIRQNSPWLIFEGHTKNKLNALSNCKSKIYLTKLSDCQTTLTTQLHVNTKQAAQRDRATHDAILRDWVTLRLNFRLKCYIPPSSDP